MTTLESHQHYIKICLDLAKQALDQGESPVGAILVHNQQTISRGVESTKSKKDITRHAEILAIQDAVQQGFAAILPQSTLYTTHEPCIMCSYVIRHYQIPRVVYGLAVNHIGGHSSEFSVLTSPSVPSWGDPPDIIDGVLAEACREITQRFKQSKKSD